MAPSSATRPHAVQSDVTGQLLMATECVATDGAITARHCHRWRGRRRRDHRRCRPPGAATLGAVTPTGPATLYVNGRALN
jgi:hypothetical protein